MKFLTFIVWLFILIPFASGCGVQETSPPESPPPSIATQAISPSVPSGLFIETDETEELPAEPHISRTRFVKIDLEQLIDGAGQARSVKEITINLFSDVVYTAVFEQVVQDGDVYSWTGILKDVENSYFTMVFTSGVFMGHFASPLGVYEVAYVRDDLYRVYQIDQLKYPGGEG